MRFIFLLLLCVSTAAFAAPDNPVDALKQSLYKQPAPETLEKTKKTPAAYWIDLPKSKRRAILTAWQNLPETTRPPFPVFRDAAMEQGRDAAHSTTTSTNAPHATPRVNTPAKK